MRFRYGFARVEQEQEHEIGVQSQRGKDGRKEEKKKCYKKNKEGTGSGRRTQHENMCESYYM